jgi:hypothetical protein
MDFDERCFGKYPKGSNSDTIPEEICLKVLGKITRSIRVIGIASLFRTRHLTKTNSYVDYFNSLFARRYLALAHLRYELKGH